MERSGGKITFREIALIVGLLFNFGGLLWSAAMTKATVDNVVSSVAKLERGYEQLRLDIRDNALLQYRLVKAEEKISDLEARRGR